jgi:transcriptional regulator with XRE-family HTH domain
MERGMTQHEAALALGIRRHQVSRMETGERMVNVVELRQFATLYRNRLDHFV